MRKFIKLTVGTALLSMVLIACKEVKKEENPQETGTEQTDVNTKSVTNDESEKTEIMTVLNANLVTEADLEEIDIPSEIIVQILEKRPFLTMNEFDELLGNLDSKEELYQKIFVPFNLNTTAEKDFQMIPGVGDRMAHEFEEYKPYISIKQFRKEIGKYVDEDEVARLENYVFVPIELNTATEEAIKALPGVGSRMAHEFEEYRPYTNIEQFRKEIGKYVDDKELKRLERFVYLNE